MIILNYIVKIYYYYLPSTIVMIGTQEQKFFTVKDVPAADFIKAYADFLKKNSKLERPAWADYVKTSKGDLAII